MNKRKQTTEFINNNPKFVGYTRVSTDKQETTPQKLAIYEYCAAKGIDTSNQDKFKFVDIIISSRRSIDERRVWEALSDLQQGDTIIVAELSRLGRSTLDILTIHKEITDRRINLVILDNKILTFENTDTEQEKAYKAMVLTFISMFAELERKLNKQRTSIAMQSKKAQGIKIGRAKGRLSKSIFDSYSEQIIYFLQKGISYEKMISMLSDGKVGTRQGIRNYIKTRKLENEALRSKSKFQMTFKKVGEN